MMNKFLSFLFDQVMGFFAWLRLAVIALCPIAAGIYSWLIGGDVAMYVWGGNGAPISDMFMQFFIAAPFGAVAFYGVRFLLKKLGVDNR